MPIALDPEARAEIVLPNDAKKPPEARPVFLARFLTCRQTLKYEQLLTEAREAKDQTTANGKLTEALTIAIVGWRNMVGLDGNPIAFGAAELDDMLTVHEKWKLVYEVMARTQLSEDERGKSNLPPISGPASIADAVQQASA